MQKHSTLRQIAQLGQPILRQRAQEVSTIHDPAFQTLIDDMIATCIDVDGVGLAAPQVYESLRLMIIASRPSKRYPKAPTMEPLAVINPTITTQSEEMEKDWEGCLSIPGIRGQVPRSTSVTVSYQTRDGEAKTETFTDFLARIFLHEYDHLEGITFLERVESTRDLITEKEYQKIIAKQ